MTDIWGFLLQTLTASGAALLLLAVKALFRDKLSPRWQFAVWGVLALVLLFPAGIHERYALFNWPLWVETAKSAATGEYGTLTRVLAPIPLPSLTKPKDAAGWLFLIYIAGAAFFLVRYLVSYIRLRMALRRSCPVEYPLVKAVAERYSQTDEPAQLERRALPVCPAVEVEGLPSAFVCGIFRPVLALPAGIVPDEKVVLHELLHLKHHDIAWGILICLFRCIHWCNPLLWYCADRAGNDLEALCDQRVLEYLSGEDRRDYGRILLSMADEKYARLPGSSSISNGGANIRRRIESIVRFKKYPAGMALVSVCVAIVLCTPLLVGTHAEAVYETDHTAAAMASARTVWCTTYAGAMDTYAKAVLTGSIPYRAMCAPLSEQNELAALQSGGQLDFGLPAAVRTERGYQIWNLEQSGENAWEGLLAVELSEPPPGEGWNDYHYWLALQQIRAEKQDGRWVVLPQGDFEPLDSEYSIPSDLGPRRMPAYCYEAQYGDFLIQLRHRIGAYAENWLKQDKTSGYVEDLLKQDKASGSFLFMPAFDTTPLPSGSFFGQARRSSELVVYYIGSEENRADYHRIHVICTPLWEGDEWHINLNGNVDGGRELSDDLEYPLYLDVDSGEWDESYSLPESYAARLWLNGDAPIDLTLLPAEGGTRFD